MTVRRVWVVIGGLVLAGCGGSGGAASTYTVAGSTSALQAAGWMPKSVVGMPHTASGVRQVGYLELTSPDGFGVDVQFLPDASDAKEELAAAEKSMPGCHGETTGNALVFSRGDGHLVIPSTTLSALKGLLRA